MNFPYGICDFRKILTQGYFYADRTDRIPLLERGEYQLFIRPRRFGKSLLLSTLFNYYDMASADMFDTLFGNLAIAQNPTALHNHYFMLQWDFSCVDPSGAVDRIRRNLHDHINSCIESFALYYKDHLHAEIRIDRENAISSIQSVSAVARHSGRPIYLLIDEYDNFANEVMMGAQRDTRRRYEAIVFEEGPLRTLFKVVKSSTSHSLFDRIFITGVSPVVMSDITSGFNIAENIFLDPLLNDLCGFTQGEVEQALEDVARACGLDAAAREEAVEMMQTWYNGYTFSYEMEQQIYNPTMTLYFLKALLQTCKYPRKMLDANLSTDRAKLEYIAQIPGGDQLLLNLARDDYSLAVKDIADRFGMREMLRDQSKDNTFMASLLYYFGVLSMAGSTPRGELSLRVPNLVIRKLYVEHIGELLLPDPQVRDHGRWAAKQLFQQGDMAPLCHFVEQRYFKVFHNADYRWANELTVKTAFLTLLYDDILYVMDSEPELERGRADLVMIIRPDMRRFEILDVLIEFKFVTLKDAGVSGKQAREMSLDDLQAMSSMAETMRDAREQVRTNASILHNRHGDLRLHGYAVVSLGFERIWWEEVGLQK